MKKIGYVRGFFKIVGFDMASRKRKDAIVHRRLHDLVMYAKEKSPYFAKAYADIGDDFELTDLPITNKKLMLENFDTWHTAPGITLKEVEEFTSKKENIGKLYKGVYSIVMSSGSSGKLAVVLQDGSMQDINGVMAALRCMKFQFPVVNICLDIGFGVDNESMIHNAGKSAMMAKKVGIVDSNIPIDQMVEKLHTIQPKSIFGYTGVISMIANEALAGRLKIKPKYVFTSGEYMSENMRKKISEAFPTAEVHSVYGCTEGGAMAYECKCNHLHLNEDWTILEGLDEDGNVVPYGTPCRKTLLTNLGNWVTPLIRYEMGDHLILHKDDCPCGKKGIWIEVDGRASTDLIFKRNGEEIVVPSMIICELIGVMHNEGTRYFRDYQLVLKPDQRLELRLDCYENEDPQQMLQKVRDEVDPYLATLRLNDVQWYLSDEKPKPYTRTGKMIHVYQENNVIGENKNVTRD